MRLVVVGNGMVGHRLVAALRDRDPGGTWEITVLAEEGRPAYDRVRLSAWFDGEALDLPAVDGVAVRLGEPALTLDPAGRKVFTRDAAYDYDALVLATGSYPFVPPVPGRDRPGCFVYRTVDDLEALSAYAAGRGTGVVVGGGLLGLEAANALRRLGLATHVVEFAPRLMPMQVDEAGGAMLRRHIEDLGMTVHTGRSAARITGAGADADHTEAHQVVFEDGGVVRTDVVVFAAGVRPRDELARAAGLTIGPRGGVVVDDACRTSDPHIFAIGECAHLGGRVYGLVAPGYAMAEVVADRLLGGAATFPGADTSTKLKLLGVDVASFGETSGPLDVTFTDPATRVYAKLVLSDDAGTLLGGILVGDASAYPTLRATLGGPLPAPPLALLASLGTRYVLDGEQATLQDTNDHFLANLQRNGTYSVVPRIPGGEITPDKLIVIGEVARDFGLYTKITGGQRIDLFGARVEQLPQIWRRLVDAGFESGHAYGKALRTVKSCVGSTWCRYGVQDSVGLAIALELRYRGLRAPHKVKAAVSGCARECAEARGKDFGVIATEAGWNLYVGGNGGFRPRHADLFLADLSTEDLVRYIDRFLMFYIRTADRLQRTASWLESMEGGLDYLRAVIVEDSLGLCEELDTMMATHVASYVDEWRATVEDPERLSRFVSFVNAPDVPDPTIQFTVERGQPVPLGQPVPVPLGMPS